MKNRLNIQNKKARFEIEILETLVAGMQLMGSEIKSIRAGKANISEAFCVITKGEMYVRNMYIDEYKQATHTGHEERRDRKLLLKRQEIDKLQKKATQKGLTMLPLKVFISQSGFAKMEIALGKGKKLHDKRDTIKDRDVKRDMDRAMKYS